MRTQTRQLSPTQARALLDATDRQRSLSRKIVARYAYAMSTGSWISAAAPPILLNGLGQVIDGQHRLAALASLPDTARIEMDVKEVDDSALLVVDTGRPRSLTDQLNIAGYPAPKGGSALINSTVYWLTGGHYIPPTASRKDLVESLERPEPTAAAIFATLVDKRTRREFRPPIGAIACLHNMAQFGEGTEQVEAYVDDLYSGLVNTDLLRRLAAHERDTMNPRTKTTMTSYTRGVLYARVYLAWLTGDHPTKLFARRRTLAELPGFGEWAKQWSILGPASMD